jgi:pSer/pThr/pTyr-binding forkhead associated (FHA) protein
MPRLIVNPQTAQAWEIPLNEGVNRLGRGASNDVAIEHESVSSAHCEIVVAAGRVTLRDLGSTSGTFLDGELVEQAVLRPGQIFHLGEVRLLYVADVEAVAETDPVHSANAPPISGGTASGAGSPAISSDGGASMTAEVQPPAACKYHPKAHARWWCPHCRLHYCDLCVNSRTHAGRSQQFCRACGGECERVEWQPAAPVQENFFASWPGAFAYPLKGDGPVLLVAGLLFIMVLGAARWVASFAPLYGLAAWLLITIIGSGYLFSYAKHIILSSAEGETKMPDWPEYTDMGTDILSPFGQYLTLTLLSFGPLALASLLPMVTVQLHGLWPQAALALAAGYGCFLLPMGLLALAMLDTIWALNPILIGRSIVRVLIPYLAVTGVFAPGLVILLFGKALLAPLLRVPVVPDFISALLGFYLLTVGMRALGLFYRAYEGQLGWFERR